MGKVYLVGAGPGDADLLTVRAARVLARADVVLHDALVSQEVLDLIRSGAEQIDVGKRCGPKRVSQEEINALLVAKAVAGDVVVRLKGGDPLIFGRAGEEIAALRAAEIDFEVIPGITAAAAAAAVARIPLTDRHLASEVVFATGGRGSGFPSLPGSGLGRRTLVVYMPGTDYGELARKLGEEAWPSNVPCVLVSGANRPGQELCWTELGGLASTRLLPAPSVLIVGSVAKKPATASGGSRRRELAFPLPVRSASREKEEWS
jgi:uroporphyrin-III C-methyltransferase